MTSCEFVTRPARAILHTFPYGPFPNVSAVALLIDSWRIGMRRSLLKLPVVRLVCFVAFGAVASSCRPATETNTNTNANTNTVANTNSMPANVNANASPELLSGISAREPDTYRATLVFTAETGGGEKTIGIPTLSAEVARSGADRRVWHPL